MSRGNALFAALIVSVNCFAQICVLLCFRASVSSSWSSVLKVSHLPWDRCHV